MMISKVSKVVARLEQKEVKVMKKIRPQINQRREEEEDPKKYQKQLKS